MTQAFNSLPVVQKRSLAYARLGVTESATLALPQITHRLRKLPGGPARALTILRGSDSPVARTFFALYDSIPVTYARMLPIEAFCLAAQIEPKRIWGLIAEETLEQGSMDSAVIAALNHAAVVEKTVEMALRDDGVDDRKMLHQHARFLPTPKGNTTTISVNATAQSAAAAQQLAPADQTVRELAERFQQHQLGAAPPRESVPNVMPADELVPVAAEYVTDDLDEDEA